MRSQLTRLVFRRLLNGQPVLHRDCVLARTPISSENNGSTHAQCQRRQFNIQAIFKPEAKGNTSAVPGFELMEKLSQSFVLKARPPEKEDLGAALALFFKEKSSQRRRLSEQEAKEVCRTLAYLRQGSKPAIGIDVIACALKTMEAPRKATTQRQDLIRQLTSELELILKGHTLEGGSALIHQAVQSLCAVGLPNDARALLASQIKLGNVKAEMDECFRLIVRGISKLHDLDFDTEMDATLSVVKSNSFEMSENLKQVLVQAYADNDRLEEAMSWLEKLQESEYKVGAVCAILNSCARLGKEKLGRQLIEKYLEKFLASKAMWMSVLRFSTGTGNGADEIDRMMDVIERRKPTSASWSIDNEVINDLVRFANARNDPYLAERFIMLGEKRGISPDLEAFMLQLEYRTKVRDIDGAMVAYTRMRQLAEQGREAGDLEAQVSAINHLIQGMCAAPRKYSVQDIMRVVDDLTGVRYSHHFESDTIAALCVMHLKRNEHDQVEALLETYTSSLSNQERLSLQNALVEFCLEKRNSLKMVWQAYSTMNKFFTNELLRDGRTKIMAEFFARRRADLAFKVFEHMRTHNLTRVRPTRDTYVAALLSAARLGTWDVVEQTHNLLKIDQDVDLDTKLRNALVIAWTYVGEPGYALRFWEETIKSTEGPSYNSIVAALKACQTVAGGFEKGHDIWNRLLELDIEITKELYTAWACCLAAWRLEDQPHREWLQKAGQFGVEVDSNLIGSVFNAIGDLEYQAGTFEDVAYLNPEALEEVTKIGFVPWLEAEYPSQVAELRSRGLKLTKRGAYVFKGIDQMPMA